MNVLWLLHAAYPKNLALAPVVVPGLTHTEATIHAVIEIIHAFTICDVEGFAPLAAKLYLQLLLSSDSVISFNAKQAIIKVLRPRYKKRRVYIPSPPHYSASASVEIEDTKSNKNNIAATYRAPTPPPPAPEQREMDEPFDVDNVVSMVLLGADANQAGAAARAVNPLEALLGPGGFPQLLDIPQAEDDEAMVELAIALSLQDHEGGAAQMQVLPQGLGNFQTLEGLQNLSGQALQSLQALAVQGLGQVQVHYRLT